ncbi:energy transducer TonB [Dyella caseinilytica]|uniref:Protein TonB n=1 Tax=Dyella caseinilytica TaxID=1849581 RepID=A0ABX7GV22_9GAMM|nr:energy transducer TonB [Dyella caseinilytica]QRN53060.1 energy transducer TonB [Dyella caseinilytica]GGA11120.1 cell envelope biogenesis protein TonB [Dyella caseinilytica]
MDTRNSRYARSRARGAVKPITIAIVAIVLGLAVLSWIFVIKPHEDIVGTDNGAHPSTPVTQGPQAAPPVNVEALSLNDLLAEARKAMNQQRVISPAGNNAFEFYLKVLQKQPGNQTAADALRETFPFAASNVEQVINQRDFNEAEREIDLLAKVDPTNYTLTILRSKLDAQRKTLDEEQQKQLDQQRQADLAAQKAVADKAAAEQAAVQKAASDKAAAAQAALAAQQEKVKDEEAAKAKAVAAQTTSENTTAAAGSTSAETREPIPISVIRPRYPPTALRNGQEGWVDVQYTVNPDGSVTNISVVSAEPRHIFDSAAIDALRRAKFSPAMRDGTAVVFQQEKRIEFKINNSQ